MLWLLLCIFSSPAQSVARELLVHVTTQDHQPLADAVVYAESGTQPPPPSVIATMDQVHKNFAPYILPVQTGTWVQFPNSDSINHHVYSFSPAKRFELKLHRGENAENRVLFDQPGIVTLGCNIHDWMLAYVVVVDTPWFAQTDATGEARLGLAEGTDWRVTIWHPRIADDPERLRRRLDGDVLIFELQQPLKPDLREQQSSYE
jgi:plastocyanin